jgi:hypothetical protein
VAGIPGMKGVHPFVFSWSDLFSDNSIMFYIVDQFQKGKSKKALREEKYRNFPDQAILV